MPQEVKDRPPIYTKWSAVRTGGKSLQFMKSEDGRFLLMAKEADKRIFFQLTEGEVASLAICLLKELMRA